MPSLDEVYWQGHDFIKDLVDQIPAAIFWKNTASVFLGCNKYFAEFAALSCPQDIVGKTDFDLPWGQFQAKYYIEDDLQIMMTRQPKLGIEEPQTLANGKELVLLTNKIPLFSKRGDVVGILGVYHDITARKKMELSLQTAKAKAELSSRVKTEFIANMSHDIRTPLSGVVGMSQLLANNLENPEHKQYARWINESGEQLLNLLNGILDVVSLENKSEFDLNTEEFDLYTCIHDIVQLERPTAKLKNIDLRIQIADAVPRYLNADRTKLHRTLLNLVGNAIKFTKKGFVAIEVDIMELLGNEVQLIFNVVDTGIGISEEMQNKVFERFYRADPSYKGVYAGHGVGLHVAKSYVELLGGKLTLQSEINVGTTFSFTIKAKVNSTKQVNNDSAHFYGQQSYAAWFAGNSEIEKTSESNLPSPFTSQDIPNILIVEDNAIALKMAELIATQAGSSFSAVVNGEDALELIHSAQFDLVLTDIGLPGISGNELARQIRQWESIHNQSPVPIVGLTAHTQSQAKDESIQAGMNEVLSKPINLQKMKSILTRFVYDRKAVNEIANHKFRNDLPTHDSQLFELEIFPLLDLEHAMQRIGNQKLLQEMLQLMVSEEIPRDELALRDAHEINDWASIEKLAHKMKGGAVYCGVFRMQYACQYLERYRKAGYSILLEDLYQQLLKVLKETKQAINNCYLFQTKKN